MFKNKNSIVVKGYKEMHISQTYTLKDVTYSQSSLLSKDLQHFELSLPDGINNIIPKLIHYQKIQAGILPNIKCGVQEGTVGLSIKTLASQIVMGAG